MNISVYISGILIFACISDLESGVIPQLVIWVLLCVGFLQSLSQGITVAQCTSVLVLMFVAKIFAPYLADKIGWGDIKLLIVLLTCYSLWQWYILLSIAVFLALILSTTMIYCRKMLDIDGDDAIAFAPCVFLASLFLE